jgi:hypothetical protein
MTATTMASIKKYWRPETGIFLAVWLVLLVGGRSRFFRDPGTFWHTVVGEHMLSQGELIYHDTFSFTFAGQRWSPHQWLGECMMALAHRLDGLDTLLLATATVLAGLYTWLALRFIRCGLHWSAAAAIVALALAASTSHFHIRPHVGTMVGMGCTMAFLCDYESRRISIRDLFWLVPIYLLWTNIHGGMLGGLATMTIACLGWLGLHVLRQKSPLAGYHDLVPLTLVITLCGLMSLVNPYGARLPGIWLEIMDSPVLPQIIQEHAPLNPWKIDGLMVLALAALYLFVLAGALPTMRITWLLPFLWFYLACTRIRHAPLFAITTALAMADAWPHTRWARWLAGSGSDLFQFPNTETIRQRPSDFRPGLLPALIVLTALFLQEVRVGAPIIGHGWARLDESYWPVELLPELQSRSLNVSEAHIFNEYLFGGFLIYFTPNYRIFVDDRCELYGDKWLADYVAAEWQGTADYIDGCERRYGPFDFALTRTGSGYDHYFANAVGWRLLRETEAADLYIRKVTSSQREAGR